MWACGHVFTHRTNAFVINKNVIHKDTLSLAVIYLFFKNTFYTGILCKIFQSIAHNTCI